MARLPRSAYSRSIWRASVIIGLLFLFFLPQTASAESVTGRVALLQTEGNDAQIIPLLETPDGRKQRVSGLQRYQPGDLVQVNTRMRSGSRLLERVPRSRASGLMLVSASWSNYTVQNSLEDQSLDYLSQWSEEASRGKWRWNPVTVLDLYFDRDLSCRDEDDFVRQIHNKVRSLGYPLYSRYRALGVVLPAEVFQKCGASPGAAGYAYLGSALGQWSLSGGLSVYNDNYTSGQWRRLLLHELGHTLGAVHARRISCSNGSLAYERTKEETSDYSGERICSTEEYGDPWDLLGSFRKNDSAFSQPAYAPGSARSVGWLPREEFIDLPLDGQVHRVSLPSYDLPTGKRILRMPMPGRSGFLRGRSPGWLWIDYRDQRGLGRIFFESYRPGNATWPFGIPPAEIAVLRFEPSEAMGAAFQMWGPLYNFPVATLKDSDDDWWCEFYDPCQSWERAFGLRVGESWQDPLGLLRVSFLEVSGSAAAIEVETPFFREPQAPRIQVNRKPRRRSAPRKALFLFSVERADSVLCQLDGRKATSCASGRYQARGLSKGWHRFRIIARNELAKRRFSYRWKVGR